MGNTLPITSPPRPSPSRAVIFLEPQCVSSYLKEPWRRPVGKLQVICSTDALPPALDGVVELEVYEEIVKSVADKAAKYRGGLIHIGLAMFQACMFMVVILGFFLSKYMQGRSFFNPITLGVLGTLELLVISQTARLLKREENSLVKDLLELFHPWRQEYGIIAKMRKTRGQSFQAGEGEGKKKSSMYYCLLLEKMGPDNDTDTVSLSAFTEIESDVESQA